MPKKETYQEMIQGKMSELSAKIDVLKAKAKQAEAATKADYEETIEDLQIKRKHAEEKLQALRNAGDGAWEDLKDGVEKSWNEFSEAVGSAVSRFK